VSDVVGVPRPTGAGTERCPPSHPSFPRVAVAVRARNATPLRQLPAVARAARRVATTDPTSKQLQSLPCRPTRGQLSTRACRCQRSRFPLVFSTSLLFLPCRCNGDHPSFHRCSISLFSSSFHSLHPLESFVRLFFPLISSPPLARPSPAASAVSKPSSLPCAAEATSSVVFFYCLSSVSRAHNPLLRQRRDTTTAETTFALRCLGAYRDRNHSECGRASHSVPNSRPLLFLHCNCTSYHCCFQDGPP
jgi:hypothetical protein